MARGRGDRMKQIFWLAVGLIALALGLIGAMLPMLPTKPFVLVAVFAFARSSPRLHTWLTNHSRFGPAIEHWQREGAISRPAKWAGVTAMIGALVLSWALGVSTMILVLQAAVLVAAAVFIISRPLPSSRS